MRQQRKALVILALLPLFIFAAASEEARPSAIADLLGKTLNFVILFGGLAFVLAKPIRAFLEARTADVRAAMAEAMSSREEAQRKLESIRLRLAGLDDEIRGIRESAEADGLRKKEMVSAAASREAEKIRALARAEIDALAQASKRELRGYAADLAVSLARLRIERRLTPELQNRLIDESIEILGRQHAERSPG